MHLVDFHYSVGKKSLLKRILLNALVIKTVVINRVLFSSRNNQILSEESCNP
jgi:hypothetical protein